MNMLMKALFLSCHVVISMIMCGSCENGKPSFPDEKPLSKPLVSAIKSMKGNQKLTYAGEVPTSWTFNSAEEDATATFTYLQDSIIIRCINVSSYYTRTFDERLYVDKSGLAIMAEGCYKLTQAYDTIHKKYLYEFAYNENRNLKSVSVTEWSGDGITWNEDESWEWRNEYIWKNGSILKYIDYNGNSTPWRITDFSYYENSEVTPNVVFVPSILIRPYYYPLCLSGYFGETSRTNIKSETIEYSDGTDCINTYSYDFSLSSSSSRIEAYYIQRDNTAQVDYSVIWSN